ncbi:hypothetical protein TRICHSKD4_4356 [Roseibium sp. TrichSKD4]|uniref:MotE family protein n=1 Tax=Roseibium sp. TrichSKD4 TaxID=744980 RepID=UPI0001E56A3C|nr:hypothetical protein [Roseibium sp. TrichSKD4]EFO30758.1 hypothetical protein TRICHSKD4_4356 [Roseibium sp. TrichSKD4]
MNVRLLPLLAISAGALLALKLLGLTFGSDGPVLPIKEAVAQEAEQGVGEASPDGEAPVEGEADTADGAPGKGGEEGAGEGAEVAEDGAGPFPDSLEIGGSAAERAVLESLGKRRQSLNEQEGQLDLREKLLQATEERIDKRVEELKALEERIESALQEKQKQEESELAGLVSMYENMKPKNAARIFNRLSMPVLLKVVRQMKPKKMADILGRMDPEAAERLTVAIASSNAAPAEPEPETQAQADELPKIQSN